MAKRKRSTETIVGVFVLVSFALLLAVVILIGRQQNIFEKRYQIEGQFDSVAGLQTGAEVHLAGINIGHVQEIVFSPENKVIVNMSVSTNQSERIRSDSIARVRTMGLMGDRYIEITVGSPQTYVIQPGGRIRTAEQFELGEALEQARPMLENIENAIGNISLLTDKLADPKGEVGTILRNVRELTLAAREGEGTIGALMTDDEIYIKTNLLLDSTQQAVDNFVELSDNAKTASDELPAILESISASVIEFEEFSKTASRAATGVEELTGSAQDVMADVKVMSENLRVASEDVRQASPRLAPLLISAEEGMGEARQVVDAAKRNWLLRGYFEPPRPGEPIIAGGRDLAAPEVVR